MTGNALAKARSILLRSLAVVAVVLTYAVGTVGTHVASMVGLSTLALATSSTAANAYYVRRRYVRVVPRRRYYRRYVRRRRFYLDSRLFGEPAERPARIGRATEFFEPGLMTPACVYFCGRFQHF